MYSGVPMSCRCSVKSVFSVRLPAVALAMPKSMTLACGLAVLGGDEDVRRLEVAVDDPLGVGVLHGVADLREELEARRDRELVLVAVLGDRLAADELHDEVRPAGLGRAGVEHLGDVGVIHHRQRLALLLEAGDDLAGVHAELDDLERHAPLDRRALLGHVDRAEAALAEELQDPVRSDLRAEAVGRRQVDGLGGVEARRRVAGGRGPTGIAWRGFPLWRGALPRLGNGSPAGRLLVFAHRRCLPVDSPESRRSCRKSPPAAR